jgi:hypothetical protein
MMHGSRMIAVLCWCILLNAFNATQASESEPGQKAVRRGADLVVKTAAGTQPLTAPEAEALAWITARPDVTEAELASAHPAVAAGPLLQRLAAAGVLAGP